MGDKCKFAHGEHELRYYFNNQPTVGSAYGHYNNGEMNGFHNSY